MLQNFRFILKAQRPILIASRQQCTEVNECNGVREITLNEAKTRNSLSMAMMDSILEQITKNQNDEQLRCIVLSAKGPIWSAGHNLKELATGDEKIAHKVFSKLSEIIKSIYMAPVPVIAKVNGLAAAAGCQLVASCDIVVSSEKSAFSTPGANFGVFCTTPGIAISRTMPRTKSAYMLLTGLPLSAHDAHIAGLVSRVVPETELDAEMETIINAIKMKSRSVTALGKKFYYEQLNMPIEEAYCKGAVEMSECLKLPDGREGLNSFVEKRKPKWSHN